MKHATTILLSVSLFMMTVTGPAAGEITSVVYSQDGGRVKVVLQDVEPVLRSQSVLNYPGLFQFSQDTLVLAYGKGSHGEGEIRTAVISRDGGETWQDVSEDSPFNDDFQISGQFGRLSDGTCLYVDALPIEAKQREAKGMYYAVKRIAEPSWRVRRFSPSAELLETFTLRLEGMPWTQGAYLAYGKILSLCNGRLLSAFECVNEMPTRENDTWRYFAKTLIAESVDDAQSFQVVDILDEPVGEHGLFNPDLVKISEKEILCMMRTGNNTPLYQSRSGDGGKSWSEPESTGWWGVKPTVDKLSNGMLACTSGRGPFGHPFATYIMFSLDGKGLTWQYPFILSTGPGCGYTSWREHDGCIEVYFSSSAYNKPPGTYALPFQSIRRARIMIPEPLP